MDDKLLRDSKARLKILLGERELLDMRIEVLEKNIVFLEEEIKRYASM